VLTLALPVALVVHEVLSALVAREGTRRATVRTVAARLVTQHRVLATAYAIGVAGAGALALAGSLDSLVGNYATPFGGDLLPRGFWQSAATHLAQVAVGAGILPLALAASWTLTTLARPERKEGHAFAALLVVLVPLLTFQVTSFDLRFTAEEFVQDRYLVYIAPLLAVGSAAWLAQRTSRSLRLVSLVAAGGALAALAAVATYDDPVIFWAAPAAAFHPALESPAGSLGLSLGEFLPLATLALVIALAVAARMAPRLTMVATALVVASFGAFEAGFVLHRYADPVMTRATGGAARDWIDLAVPRGHSAALVPSSRVTPPSWWEAELWNKDVQRVLRVGSGPTFTPFPADNVGVDFADGTLRGPQPSDYLVVSPDETRFELRADTQVARAGPLQLVHVRRPYRLSWATRGLTPDGWARPLRLTTLRLYGNGRWLQRSIVVTLAAPRSASKSVDFVFRGHAGAVRGRVDPGGARPPIRLTVCVPARGYADATLVTSGDARIADGRFVALHVDRLRVHDAGPCGAT
jgi:hypothetical protein